MLLLLCFQRFPQQGFRQFPDALHGKGRLTEWFQGDAHEPYGIVVRCHPVGAEFSAPLTAVDDGPLAALAHPHGHRFHHAAAVRFPVTRFNVHMEAAEAVGTVVAVVAGRALWGHQPATDLAGEAVAAWMSFVISFFKLFTFVFSVHFDFLLKICVNLPGGMAESGFARPPGQATLSFFILFLKKSILLFLVCNDAESRAAFGVFPCDGDLIGAALLYLHLESTGKRLRTAVDGGIVLLLNGHRKCSLLAVDLYPDTVSLAQVKGVKFSPIEGSKREGKFSLVFHTAAIKGRLLAGGQKDAEQQTKADFWYMLHAAATVISAILISLYLFISCHPFGVFSVIIQIAFQMKQKANTQPQAFPVRFLTSSIP